MKKQSLQEARLGMKRFHNENLAQKVADIDAYTVNKDQQLIMKKAANQSMYEKLCHIQAL